MVKLCLDSKFFSFYLELLNVYKNKFNNSIRRSKLKFSFRGLFVMYCVTIKLLCPHFNCIADETFTFGQWTG